MSLFVNSTYVFNSVTPQDTDDVSYDQFLQNDNVTVQNLRDEDVLKLGMDVLRRSEYSVVPMWTLIVYFAIVNITGFILNMLICVGYIFKKNKKGIHTLILQMAISDLISLTIVSVPELWSHQSGSWIFGSAVCRLYSSFEVFAGTSNIYFLVAMNLHALASVNLMRKYPGANKDVEEELLEDVTEMKSSQHNLVSRASTLSSGGQTESPPRNKKPTIPVVLPLIFVWILSASLSMPEIPLSTVIESSSGTSICTFLEGYHLISMRVMLTVFQLFIPFIILTASSAMIVYKICTIPAKGTNESLCFLKTSLFLCALFLLCSVPRFMLASLHGLWMGNKEDAIGMDRYRSPPLSYDVTPISVPIVLSFLHFLTPVVKPIGYLYFFKKYDKKKFHGAEKRQHRNTQIQ